MRTMLALALGTALIVATASAQSTPRPAFEVASINAASPLTLASIQSGATRVGMTVNDARVDIAFFSVADLLPLAYRVKAYQISGPAWMSEQRFDIRATLPAGSNSDQVPEMLRTLLADRFGLVAHTESREMAIYSLAVSKEGSKLREAAPDPGAPAEPPPADLVLGSGDSQLRVSKSADGLSLTSGRNGAMRIRMGDAGAIQMDISRISMHELADFLTMLAGRPVFDRTGLAGAYQFVVDLPLVDLLNLARNSGMLTGLPPGLAAVAGGPGAAAEPVGSGVFQAVQKLGLRLDPQRAPVDVIVVDRLEKMPTAN